jgi:DNA integrity scanning protein DisA with diadenylate cyclase activity
MTKETLVVQLEAAKSLSSQVDIDKVIELIKQIETPTRITQELADDICSKIERCLDNNSDDLVDKENVSFSIGYGNTIEIDDAQIDTYEVMRHISDVLDDFVNEEEDENETGYTLPGFENGSGIDQVTIY